MKKLEIIWDTVFEDAIGEDFVTGARIQNVKSKEVKDISGCRNILCNWPYT